MATPSITKTPKTCTKQRNQHQPSKIRVVARLRPFLPPEILHRPISSCVSVLESDHDGTLIHLTDRFTSRQECYKLDAFYKEENSTTEIFQKEVTPLISSIFRGCNATVFACGATGSGKTHLMQGSGEAPGLMSLSMSVALGMCESSGSVVEISYYEVYMDKCFDLLQQKQQEVSVLDDKDGQVHLRGLTRVKVGSMSEFHRVLNSSLERRKVAHTGLNDVSSRSHGVLVIVVSSPCCDGSGFVVLGKLNLIDLAGNEDNRKTENEGIRLQESAMINRSLFTLSNVISALNNNEPRVPYRESKLTRILQDSLGGNSRSLMIACLNPSEYQESVNTVSLASRSCHITNPISSARKEETPTVKIDMEEKLRAWLESKGKTKSTQRLRAFGSPLPGKTPLSTTRSIKKQSSCQSYAKVKDATGQCSTNARRNLFKSGAATDSFMEESCCSNASKCSEEPTYNYKQSVEEYKDCSSVKQVDGAKISNAESSVDRAIPPCPDIINAVKEVHSSNVEVYEEDIQEGSIDMCEENHTSGVASNMEVFKERSDAQEDIQDGSIGIGMCKENHTGGVASNMEVFEERSDAQEDTQDGSIGMCKENHTGSVVSNMEVFEERSDAQEDIQDGSIGMCKENHTGGVASNMEVFEECPDAQEDIQDGSIGMCKENHTGGVASNMEVFEECKDAQEYIQDSGIDICEENHTSGVASNMEVPEECSDARENIQEGGTDKFEGNHTSGVAYMSSMPEIKAPVAMHDDLLNKENLECTPCKKSVRTPAVSSLRKVISPVNYNSSLKPQEDIASKCATPAVSSLRKVLSPVNYNSSLKPQEDIASKSAICKTPSARAICKTPSALIDDGDALQGICTPLDKYNARSSNLKSSLAQEYLDFLNSANKEELLKLKGIGPRRAEHIVDLRETSPLKSLSDLGKIGLSNKQVNGLFKRAAKGLFD